MTKDEVSNIQYNNSEVYEKFHNVYSLEGHQLARDSDNSDELFLILHPRGKDPVEYPVFKAKRQLLLNLAKLILREVDPTPEDKILETLKRIEQILKHQNASH